MTNRSIFINDTLLMFRLVDSSNTKSINTSDAFYEAFYGIKYLNGSLDMSPIMIEICELGKNINMKFENLVNEMEKLGKKVNEFYIALVIKMKIYLYLIFLIFIQLV